MWLPFKPYKSLFDVQNSPIREYAVCTYLPASIGRLGFDGVPPNVLAGLAHEGAKAIPEFDALLLEELFQFFPVKSECEPPPLLYPSKEVYTIFLIFPPGVILSAETSRCRLIWSDLQSALRHLHFVLSRGLRKGFTPFAQRRACRR